MVFRNSITHPPPKKTSDVLGFYIFQPNVQWAIFETEPRGWELAREKRWMHLRRIVFESVLTQAEKKAENKVYPHSHLCNRKKKKKKHARKTFSEHRQNPPPPKSHLCKRKHQVREKRLVEMNRGLKMFNMKTDCKGGLSIRTMKSRLRRKQYETGLQGGTKIFQLVLFFLGGGFLDLKHGVLWFGMPLLLFCLIKENFFFYCCSALISFFSLSLQSSERPSNCV